MYTANMAQRLTHRQQVMLLSLLGTGLLLLGLLSGGAMAAKGWLPFSGQSKGLDSGDKTPSYLTAEQRNNGQVMLNTGFSTVAKAVTPAVVTVEVSARAKPQPFPFSGNPFRDFFGLPDQDDGQMPRQHAPQPQL